MDFQDLNRRIDVAGQLPSRINDAAVEFIHAHPDLAVELAPVLSPLYALSKALVSVQQWATVNDPRNAPTALPAGQVVVDAGDVGDVGDNQGKGPIKAADMSPANWAYYQQHNLGPKWAQIFSDSLATVNAAIGAVPGNLSQYGDGAPVVGNWTLSTWG